MGELLATMMKQFILIVAIATLAFVATGETGLPEMETSEAVSVHPMANTEHEEQLQFEQVAKQARIQVTKTKVASSFKKFKASERLFKKTRATLAKVRAATVKRIAEYRAKKISLKMKSIALGFKKHSLIAAHKIRNSKKFSKMIKIARALKRHMQTSTVSMRASLKASAAKARKVTSGAFSKKSLFMMEESAWVTGITKKAKAKTSTKAKKGKAGVQAVTQKLLKEELKTKSALRKSIAL